MDDGHWADAFRAVGDELNARRIESLRTSDQIDLVDLRDLHTEMRRVIDLGRDTP